MGTVIGLVEAADNYPLAGAGMNKLSILEIDAHVGHFSARFPAAEKYQIAFPKIPPGNFAALFLLAVCTSLQFDVIHLFINLASHSRAVSTTFRLPTSPVRGTYPL